MASKRYKTVETVLVLILDGFAMIVVKIILGWLFSIVVVFGPYALLLKGFGDIIWQYDALYWGCMLVYVLFGFVTEINITTDDWSDAAFPNPFSYEDEAAQSKIFTSLLLLPAVVIAWTVKLTWYSLRGNHR